MKMNDTIPHDSILDILILSTIGRRMAISTSKIKKITAIKKNRRENGIRDLLNGSNPHSNGDLFSRSIILFFDKIEDTIIRIIVIVISIKLIIMMKLITYPETIQTFWLEVKYTNILGKYLPHQ